MTNKTMDSCTSSFLLNRSENFPHIGVLTVIMSRLAVMTQVYSRWVPSKSAMIVGKAVETMVVESSAVNSPANSPVMTRRTSLRDNAGGSRFTSSFLLNRSENLPHMGVLTVIMSRLAVMTQVYSRWVPSKSAMIVGKAVETMVVESSAVNSPANSPVMTRRTSLRDNAGGSAVVVVVIVVLFLLCRSRVHLRAG